jgi:Txe/YoeB family toxin of Txe-Axe toxin-antitoxin module
MHSITININNDKLADKVTQLLESFKNDGLEIVSKEDMEDLKLLKATRNIESIPYEDYLKDAD